MGKPAVQGHMYVSCTQNAAFKFLFFLKINLDFSEGFLIYRKIKKII